MNLASELREGDLVSTCDGINEVVVRLDYEWWPSRKGRGQVLGDIEIFTARHKETQLPWTPEELSDEEPEEDCFRSCSAANCCLFPRWTGEEVRRSFEWLLTPSGQQYLAKWKEQGYEFSFQKKYVEGSIYIDDNGMPRMTQKEER